MITVTTSFTDLDWHLAVAGSDVEVQLDANHPIRYAFTDDGDEPILGVWGTERWKPGQYPLVVLLPVDTEIYVRAPGLFSGESPTSST